MDRIRIHPNTELQLSLNNVHTSAGAAKASPKRKTIYNPHSELQHFLNNVHTSADAAKG